MSGPAREPAGAFVAPWAAGVALLTAVPLAGAFALSMMRWNGLDARTVELVGGANYEELIGWTGEPAQLDDPAPWRWLNLRPSDPLFARALWNSVAYSLLAAPAEVLGGLGVALLLWRGGRGMRALQLIVYLPYLLGGVSALLVWSWLLNPQFGWINLMLRGLYAALDPILRAAGGAGTGDWPTPGWLFSPDTCKPALVLIRGWSVGGSALIFLAGLRRIPDELLENAELDGADRAARTWHLTLPLLRPVLSFVTLLSVIFAMQSFTESFVLQTRAQRDGLLFVTHFLYRTAFESPFQLGRAAAAGILLLSVTALLIAPILLLARRPSWRTEVEA